MEGCQSLVCEFEADLVRIEGVPGRRRVLA